MWWRKAMHMLGLDEQAEYEEMQQAQAAPRPDGSPAGGSQAR